MTDLATLDDYGALTEPRTLRIQRLLPGPIDRVWRYLVEEDLRRQWMAAGAMLLEVGASFELVWRNDTLTLPPGTRPEGFGPEHRMKGRIIALDAPRKLAITWGEASDVTFDLEPRGSRVLLTVTHRRLPDRSVMLNVCAGWHAHLDVLVIRLDGSHLGAPFWDHWARLKADYERRLPG